MGTLPKPRHYGSVGRLDPPSWLAKDAKAWWRRVARPLSDEGQLNPITADLLAMAADSYGTYREAGKQLAAAGRVVTTHTGALKPNPWLAVEKDAFARFARVFKELGLSAPNKPDSDDLDDFLTEDDGP